MPAARKETIEAVELVLEAIELLERAIELIIDGGGDGGDEPAKPDESPTIPEA
jgi:hypothetical protein